MNGGKIRRTGFKQQGFDEVTETKNLSRLMVPKKSLNDKLDGKAPI